MGTDQNFVTHNFLNFLYFGFSRKLDARFDAIYGQRRNVELGCFMTSRKIFDIISTAQFCVISLPNNKTNISVHFISTLLLNHKTLPYNVFI